MNKYKIKKDEARQKAIDFQTDFAENNYSYDELFITQQKFYKLAKRYGLKKEFSENAII